LGVSLARLDMERLRAFVRSPPVALRLPAGNARALTIIARLLDCSLR
jgi:hypothetical protein